MTQMTPLPDYTSPVDVFARAAYLHIAGNRSHITPRSRDEIVLAALTDPSRKPEYYRTGTDMVANWLGVRIRWPQRLPDLRTWAGQQTLRHVIEARREALAYDIVTQAKKSRQKIDLPEDVGLLDWRRPIHGMLGIDHRSTASNLDIGFSPDALGMRVNCYAAAELLAILGVDLMPLIRWGHRAYGYITTDHMHAPDPDRRPRVMSDIRAWRFACPNRSKYLTTWSIATEVAWNDVSLVAEGVDWDDDRPAVDDFDHVGDEDDEAAEFVAEEES